MRAEVKVLGTWLVLSCAAPEAPDQRTEPVDLLAAVDPFIGTGGLGFQVGSGVPGATLPFGHVRLSPDTADHMGSSPGFHRGGGYHADDTLLRAISHTHLHGVGLTDYGAVGVIPVDGLFSGDGRPRTLEPNRRPTLEAQQAGAGWFELTLSDPNVEVALTATQRTGLHRYRFADDVDDPTLIIDLGHTLGDGEVTAAELSWSEDGRSLAGWRHSDGEMADDYTVYFVAQLDRSPSEWGTFGAQGSHGLGPRAATSSEGPDAGAWARFDDDEVYLRVAVSLVDLDGARANLEAEHGGFAYTADRTEAQAAWAELFVPVRVWGGSAVEQRIFASALYHCAIMPSQVDDVDGRYRGFDGENHDDPGHAVLSDMSLWDTYRTTHPLYTLLWPDHHRDMLRSLVRMAQDGGNLPRWPMVTEDGGFMLGSPAHLVGAEAHLKGLDNFEEQAFFEAARIEALGLEDPLYAGRPDPTLVDTYGYYPSDEVGRSVAWLQEAAIADFALAGMSADLGDPETTALLEARAETWRNVWDPDVGYFHGRLASGEFDTWEGDSTWSDDYAEGNARQYLWLVPHDPEGLFEVLGGNEAAVARLDEFFEETVASEDEWAPGTPEPWYWHGNEPDIHAPWLYALAGAPEETVRWVRWVMETRYSDASNGLWGNDDGGTLSAWYVWAAMGIYPLAGTDRYVLGDPLFHRVELDLPDGTFIIERLGRGPLAEVWLDETRLETHALTHDQLVAGSVLRFLGDDAAP